VLTLTPDAPLELRPSQRVDIDCGYRGVHLRGGTFLGPSAVLAFHRCEISVFNNLTTAVLALPGDSDATLPRGADQPAGSQANSTIFAEDSTFLFACVVRLFPALGLTMPASGARLSPR
jgi:hypothetical protein